MTITQKIQDHPINAVLIISTTICAFLFAVMAWFYADRIAAIQERHDAQLTAVKSKLDAIQLDQPKPARLVEEKSPSPGSSESKSAADIEKVDPLKNSTAESSSDKPKIPSVSSKPTVAQKPVEQDRSAPEPISKHSGLQTQRSDQSLFRSTSPYPFGYEGATIGKKLSELRLMFPNGKVGAIGFEVNPLNGPISQAVYFFDNESTDPISTRVAFYFSGEKEYSAARQSAGSAFAGAKLTELMGGDVLLWRFKNYEATFRGGYYTIQRTNPSATESRIPLGS